MSSKIVVESFLFLRGVNPEKLYLYITTKSTLINECVESIGDLIISVFG